MHFCLPESVCQKTVGPIFENVLEFIYNLENYLRQIIPPLFLISLLLYNFSFLSKTPLLLFQISYIGLLVPCFLVVVNKFTNPHLLSEESPPSYPLPHMALCWGHHTLAVSLRGGCSCYQSHEPLPVMDLLLSLLLALTYSSLLLHHLAKPLLWHPGQSTLFYHWLLPVSLITRYHLLKVFHLSNTLKSWVLLLSYMWLEGWCERVNSCPNLSILWLLFHCSHSPPWKPLDILKTH